MNKTQKYFKKYYKDNKKYKCILCETKYMIKTAYQEHYQTEKHKENFQVILNRIVEPNYKNNPKPKIKSIYKSNIAKEYPFKCDSCEYVFKTEEQLYYHTDHCEASYITS